MKNENGQNMPRPTLVHLMHRYTQLIKALGAGVVGVLAQTAVFEVCFQVLHYTTASTAVVIGAEAGILTNFYLNNRFSFADRVGSRALFSRLIQFHLVVSGSVIMQWTLVFITEHLTQNTIFLHGAFLAGVGIGFVWNYTWYRMVIWRHTH